MKEIIIKYWPIFTVFIIVLFFTFPYWGKGLIPFPGDYLVTSFPPWQYYYGMPVKNNAMPDVISQMFPFKHLVISYWKQGIVPLWNPNNFSGNPLLANYQSAVFHPLNGLFFVLNEIDAWSLLILAQPLLAGLFMYWFARQFISPIGALLSSISFMFCGFITTWMAYGTLSYALLWLPLSLLAVEKNFRRLSPWWLLVISFSLAASFFCGHFQTSLYVLGATVAFSFFRFITSKNFPAGMLILIYICLGVGLAALQILPAVELHQLSVRAQAYGIGEVIPFQWLITLFAPDFYGNQVTRNNWFGHYAEWLGFIGTIPLALAVKALLRPQQAIVRFFTFLGLAALLFTLPTPLLSLIEKARIPVISTSAVSRIIAVFSFSFAVLAGFGLEQLRSDLETKKIKKALISFAPMLFIAAGVWVTLLFVKPFSPENLSVAKRNTILPTFMSFVPVVVIIYCWLILKFKPKNKIINRYSISLALAVLILLSAFDMFRFAQKWLPFSPRQYVYPKLEISQYLSQTVPPDRLFGYFGMELMNYHQIPGFNGYDPVYSRRYGQLLMSASTGIIKEPSTRGVSLERRELYTLPLLNLMGGKYLLHALDDGRNVWTFPYWDYPDQFQLIFETDKYQVYLNRNSYPRAFLAYDYRVVSEPQQIIDALYSGIFDLRQTLVLEETPPLPPVQTNSRSSAEILSYQPERIEIKTSSPQDGLLFLSDNYFPGWTAFVDGRESKIFRADYTFRSVVVPAGDHLVKFAYTPNSFKQGILISFVSFSLSIVLFAYLKFMHHDNRSV